MKDIKAKRLAAGMSQYDLSGKSGVPRWKIQLAENGHIELTAEETKKIKGSLPKESTSGKK